MPDPAGGTRRSDRHAVLDDAALDAALRDLSGSLAVPMVHAPDNSDDLATRVRERIVAEELSPVRVTGWRRWRTDGTSTRRPGRWRSGLALAAVLVLAIAATAGAVGLGLPGLRILLGPPPTATPDPALSSPGPVASSPPGAFLGLGTLVKAADIDRLTSAAVLGFEARYPSDPSIDEPTATYLSGGRLAFVWAPGPSLPETSSPGIGLLLTQFAGSVDGGYFTKIADEQTTVTPIDVAGSRGFWISGEVHFFFYTDPSGRIVEDSRRWVGDTLVWTRDGVTYRLEAAVGLDRALEIAESLR